MTEPVPGLFTLVLHTHLPWLAHHGRWHVGEEWLYQSWSAAYLPLMRVLRTLAAEDRRHLVTLGMTPVVTAQLDDPYCLTGMHHWLANWQLRALEAATQRELKTLWEFGIREHAEAGRALITWSGLARKGDLESSRRLEHAAVFSGSDDCDYADRIPTLRPVSGCPVDDEAAVVGLSSMLLYVW